MAIIDPRPAPIRRPDEITSRPGPGVWYDTRNHRTTTTPPAEGVLLVKPGAVIPSRVLAELSDDERDALPPVPGSPLAHMADLLDVALESSGDGGATPAAGGAEISPRSLGGITRMEPRHVGGGWYELPNGERVRGRDEAEVALDLLADPQ